MDGFPGRYVVLRSQRADYAARARKTLSVVLERFERSRTICTGRTEGSLPASDGRFHPAIGRGMILRNATKTAMKKLMQSGRKWVVNVDVGVEWVKLLKHGCL